MAVLHLIRWEQFPCSMETYWALIFWPPHPLARRVVAMPCPMRLCAVQDERRGCLDLRRKGVRWYSDCYPHRCRGMDVIMVK
jgi:hypothetical protein